MSPWSSCLETLYMANLAFTWGRFLAACKACHNQDIPSIAKLCQESTIKLISLWDEVAFCAFYFHWSVCLSIFIYSHQISKLAELALTGQWPGHSLTHLALARSQMQTTLLILWPLNFVDNLSAFFNQISGWSKLARFGKVFHGRLIFWGILIIRILASHT